MQVREAIFNRYRPNGYTAAITRTTPENYGMLGSLIKAFWNMPHTNSQPYNPPLHSNRWNTLQPVQWLNNRNIFAGQLGAYIVTSNAQTGAMEFAVPGPASVKRKTRGAPGQRTPKRAQGHNVEGAVRDEGGSVFRGLFK
jgi:hypothetical protein